MSRPRVGILFGGVSEEHAVSVKSAREVAAALDRARFDPVWIGITRGGSWLVCAGPDDGWDSRDGGARDVVLSPDPSVRGLHVIGAHGNEIVGIDVVLPVLHGRRGEDGAVQGLLELAGLPYAGCDLPSSAVCMDKSLAYVLARAAGIGTPEFRILFPGDVIESGLLEYPVFVKPARSGSSFGVSKVESPERLAAAIETAREFDAKVLIEQAVVGSEIGCAILGDGPDLVAGEIDRVALSHGFFRIHQEEAPEAASENATFIVPADIPAATRARATQTALAIYRALGCRGIARVDMFLTESGDILLNEVNTLPGLTSYSRYPRMMAAAGLSLTEVLRRLIDSAMARPPR